VGFANVVIVHKYCGFPLDFQLNEELIIKKKRANDVEVQ
jgi:hypothetical protein